MKKLALLVMLIANTSAGLVHADPVVDRMRDQLRQTILQMRQLEDENLSLKAKLAHAAPAAPAPVVVAKVNTAELKQLREAARLEKARADEMQGKVSEVMARLEQLQHSLAQAGNAARSQQQASQNLDSQLKAAAQKTQLCEDGNKQLAALAGEVLDQYRRQSFWQAMRAHEPVTGLYRVRLENAVQDYQNKMANATLASTAATESASATTP